MAQNTPYNPWPAKPKNFEGVKQVLDSTLKKFGIDKDIARYQFVLRWKEIVGDEIAKRTRPECFRGNSLVVRVTDSAWAQELAFQKDIILNRLKRFVGDKSTIDDIFFVVGKV